MKNFVLAVIGLCLSAVGYVNAAENNEELIRQNLQKIDPRIKVKTISDAPISGMSEIELNSGEVVYADSKGEFFLIGQLYQYSQAGGFVNLTEEKAKGNRKGKLETIPDEQMVVFAPEGEVKATVNIFTDVDCPYCRKLHEEIPQLNAMGVQVNYLAFPRNGMNSRTYQTMVSIWCAGDAEEMRSAMTEAKVGGQPELKSCENPVLGQLALGQNVGVTGTPALVLEDGTLVPGYIPAARLGKMLGL